MLQMVHTCTYKSSSIHKYYVYTSVACHIELTCEQPCELVTTITQDSGFRAGATAKGEEAHTCMDRQDLIQVSCWVGQSDLLQQR